MEVMRAPNKMGTSMTSKSRYPDILAKFCLSLQPPPWPCNPTYLPRLLSTAAAVAAAAAAATATATDTATATATAAAAATPTATPTATANAAAAAAATTTTCSASLPMILSVLLLLEKRLVVALQFLVQMLSPHVSHHYAFKDLPKASCVQKTPTLQCVRKRPTLQCMLNRPTFADCKAVRRRECRMLSHYFNFIGI